MERYFFSARSAFTRGFVHYSLLFVCVFLLGLVWEATNQFYVYVVEVPGGFLYIDSACSHVRFLFFLHYTCSLLLLTTYLFVMHGNRRLLGMGLWIWFIRLGWLVGSTSFCLLFLGKVCIL